MKKIDAKTLLNFLATAAEVLADDAEPFASTPERFAALAEELARLADEYPEELEAALETAVANGLQSPWRKY